MDSRPRSFDPNDMAAQARQLLQPATRAAHQDRWKTGAKSLAERGQADGVPDDDLARLAAAQVPRPAADAGLPTEHECPRQPADGDETGLPRREVEQSGAGSCEAPADTLAPADTVAPVGTPPSSDQHPNYLLLRELGRSENSVVYEAFERTLGRYVAIKQLTGCGDAGSREAELFWQEARFLAELRHENIVSVYAVDVARNWLIMERMKGSVRELMPTAPLAPELVRSIVRQALEGLKYLHGKDKIHGEIKPSRVLIDGQGCVRISHSPGRLVDGEFRVPTRSQHHVAPELLQADVFGQLGPGVDLYCLAFVALELLVGPELGRRLKGVESEGERSGFSWFRWHSSPSESLPPIRELAPGAPDDLVFVLQRMTRKFVDERYGSAAAALEDLEKSPLVLVDLAAAAKVPGRTTQRAGRDMSVNAPPNLVPKRKKNPPRSDLADWLKDLWRRLALVERAMQHPYRTLAVCGAGMLLLAVLTSLAAPRRSGETADAEPLEPGLLAAADSPLDLGPDDQYLPDNVERAPAPAALPPAGELPSPEPADAARHSVLVSRVPAADPDPLAARAETSPAAAAEKRPAKPESVAEDTEPESKPSLPTLQPSRWYYEATREQPWPLPAELNRHQRTAYVTAVSQILEAITGPDRMQARRAVNTHYDTARRICDSDPRVHHAVALVLMDQFRNREAEPYLLDAIRCAPESYVTPYRHQLFNTAVQGNHEQVAAQCVQLLEYVFSVRQPADREDPVVEYNAWYVGAVTGWLDGLQSRRRTANLCEDPVIRHLLEYHPGALAQYDASRNTLREICAYLQQSSAAGHRSNRSILERYIPLNFDLEARRLLRTFPEDVNSITLSSTRIMAGLGGLAQSN